MSSDAVALSSSGLTLPDGSSYEGNWWVLACRSLRPGRPGPSNERGRRAMKETKTVGWVGSCLLAFARSEMDASNRTAENSHSNDPTCSSWLLWCLLA